ncbi:TPA: ead/Ea22-like family protein [Escherichia coli]
MNKIDYQALREAAEKATKGSYIVGHTSVNKHGNLTGVFVCQKWKGEPGGVIAECHVNCLVETDAQAYANAEFIAAFNPKIALALLDEREAKDKVWSAQDNHINQQADRIESLEKKNGDLGRALEAAEKRIAELEANKCKPVMFIDGDISPADADKLAAVIREFNEETETPAARMARIIRENPHPTNMCDMPAAGIGKGE